MTTDAARQLGEVDLALRRGSARTINPETLRTIVLLLERVAFAAIGWAMFAIAGVALSRITAPASAFAATTVVLLFIILTRPRTDGLQRFFEMPLSDRFKEIAVATVSPFFVSLTLSVATVSADADNYRAAFIRWQSMWCLAALTVLAAHRRALAATLRRWRSEGRLTRRIAIVGYGELTVRLIRWLNEFCPSEVHVIGIFDDRSPSRLRDRGLEQSPSGTVDALIELAKDCKIDRVIVALPHAADQRILALLRKLKQIPVDISLAPDMAGFATAVLQAGEFGGLPLVNVYGHPLQASQRLIKDWFDRMAAAAALAMLSPALLLIAIAVKLDSKGPALFQQRRHGFGGGIISVWKFRTMDAKQTDHGGRQQTKRNDPRLTRLGSLLRRTSLDELPQLFNVLRGEMSLVGPRPLPVQMQIEERLSHEIVSDYALRHRIKPGITGWAQVNGYRGAVASAEALRIRVAYDLSYIENWSFWFDLRILLMTAWALIGGENAF